MPSPPPSSGRATLLAALVLVTGCRGLLGPGEVTRTVGGETRRGIFVSPYSYEHFLRGELAYVAGDWARAAEEFRAARAGPEDDALLIARLADCLDRLGREEQALELLAQGESLDPDSELLHLERGRIHARHDRVEEARAAFARAAAAAPRSEEGPIALATLLRDRQPTEADAVLERYLARVDGTRPSPGAARVRLRLAVERGDAAAAAEAVRQLLEVAPARADEVRAAARTALAADHPELALRLAQALPATDEDRELRLTAALAAGEHDQAEGLLAAWMPSRAAELTRVAEGYLAIGEAERAVELARVATAADGGAPAELALGRALRAAGSPGEAARVLAAIAPGSQAWPAAPIELAGVLADVGRPALAAETLAAAAARRPSPELALALGAARARLGDLEGALEALEGDDPPLAAARARALEEAGRPAADAYADLPVDDPRLSERDRLRATVERRWATGEREAAVALLATWVERAPEDRGARARLAAMRREEGG